MRNSKFNFLKHTYKLMFAIIIAATISCEDESLPGVGDIPDRTPPSADFGESISTDNFLKYTIVNKSISATDFIWTIPAGVTLLSTAEEGENPLTNEDIIVLFPSVGTYEFSLTSSDKNNVKSSITKSITIQDIVAPAPVARFEYTSPNEDFLIKRFVSTSFDATGIEWILPNGVNLEEGFELTDDIVELKFDAEGTYPIGITAKNIKGEEITLSEDIVVEAIKTIPVPVILVPGFDLGNNNDTKDPWRNSALGGVLQISSSSSFEGGFSSKFPTDASRIAYQEIAVTPNANYTLAFNYSQDVSTTGSVTVSVLGGSVNDSADIAGATLGSFEGTNATGKGDFTTESISFNSGTNSIVAIYITNSGGTVSYVDTLSISVDSVQP